MARATSRATSGASAPSTRNSPSMSTATPRSPTTARAASGRLLEGMQRMLGWDPIMDGDNIIGLVEPTGQGAISLEPGGQFELSGAPLETLHQTCRENQRASGAAARDRGTARHRFLGLGGSPKWTLRRDAAHAEVALRHHDGLHAQGRHAGPRHDVPHLHDPGESRLRVGSRHASQDAGFAETAAAVATALFANSPFTEGAPNGLSRGAARSGATPTTSARACSRSVFRRHFGFERLRRVGARRADVFRHPRRTYHDVTHVTFRQFMDGALRNSVPDGCRPSATGRTTSRRCFPTCG
jgi:glutamate--cysteine ligase